MIRSGELGALGKDIFYAPASCGLEKVVYALGSSHFLNHSMKKQSSKIETLPETKTAVIYEDNRGNFELKVDKDLETIWVTQLQVAELFDVQKAAISKHLKNIFASGELQKPTTVSKMETVQTEGGRTVKRAVEFYNLDLVIAIGYRVNSKKATLFRQWATKTLRDYLVKGYILNEKRLRESRETSVKELQKTVKFIQETVRHRQLDQAEVDSVLSVITGYANSWLLLGQYDESALSVKRGASVPQKKLEYETVRMFINDLKRQLLRKGEAGELFGNERNDSLQGILTALYQTFDGKEVYSSAEEKAAHLLYFVIKDHPFSDGNKRIGSFLFIIFLGRNQLLYRKNGEKKINDNTLVALALLVAQSDPKEKDQMIALITQLLA